MKVTIQSIAPLFDYQFEVPDTGIIGIYGISGSGKTSLLRSLAGFQTDLRGTIEFLDSTNLDTENKIYSGVQKCSYMNQDSILFPHWTVAENLNFAEVHSRQESENTSTLLTQLNCHDLLNKYPSQLSGGEKQRVAFIRSLISARTNQLILLDEPFSALDQDMRAKALEILNQFRTTHLVFLVTHDINELYHYADELLYINNGKIQYQDNISGAMSDGKFQLPIASKVLINNTIQIIYADDVSISLESLKNTSIIHQYNVTIIKIDRDKDQSILKLKTADNQILFAKITSQSLNKLKLTLNQNVMANFKATSFK